MKTVITMSSDLFKRSEVATVAGMAGTFGNAGVLIFSLLIGALVSSITRFNPLAIAHAPSAAIRPTESARSPGLPTAFGRLV